MNGIFRRKPVAPVLDNARNADSPTVGIEIEPDLWPNREGRERRMRKGRLMKAPLCLLALLGAWSAAPTTASTTNAPGPDPREHWAFRPPSRPAVPPIPDRQFSARNGSSAQVSVNPIDAFVLHEWARHDLTPTSSASKETLLRRVYLDLIGLPPTREELLAFVADPSPEAYERVVDRLLASRQHAERWARHWMDIWRYADWYGRRHVPDVWNSAPQVWRWRDWLVRSLAADQGYDRMITEMLAADELSPVDDHARAATGYLVRNWYALNPNQWMRDIVEHTGKAFLGLTFNCAHCHDHKADPITQRDYFQFRAFFEPLQVRQDWVAGEPDPGPFQKYDYSVTRKVVTNGLVSVFDENLEAKTFVYLRGDERNLPEGKPTVRPAMPAFLNGDVLKVNPVDLPATVRYPGLKPFIREAERTKREQALATARQALTNATTARDEAQAKFARAEATNSLAMRVQASAELLSAALTFAERSNQLAIALADLESLRARIAADDASFKGRSLDLNRSDTAGGPGESTITHLAAAASRAERRVALLRAEARLGEAESAVALLESEQTLAAARRRLEAGGDKKEDEDKRAAALKKARERLELARKDSATARLALETNRTDYTPLSPQYPAQSSGRRRALALWLVSTENPLTARVAVNHIWARHFHAPLVASVFDFGRNGSRPTHPGLLDWLAVEFMEHGWSMKHLHRLIVTSRAYRQSSAMPDPGMATANQQRDPSNRYLWRMNRGQMEAETLRDSLLHLSGELDLTPVGYPLPNTESDRRHHRSLYFECFPEPNGASALAGLFDAPNPIECYRRTQTIVPQQALALANSKLSDERSRALSRRLAAGLANATGSDSAAFITAAYEQILTRPPTAAEVAACQGFLTRQAEAESVELARVGLVRVLFNHNDFVSIR